MMHAVVLLPSRRACRNFKQYLQELAVKTPMVLPRIYAMSDIDQDPVFFAELIGIDHAAAHTEPKAIHRIERRFLLANACANIRLDQSEPVTMRQAFELADALAQLLDELQRQQISLDSIQDVSPDLYAEHWQEILNFLNIITEHWPHILAEKNQMDPINKRNHYFQTLAENWGANAPKFPIVIAGTTGSNLAVTKLMQVVAKLPQGTVVLPAFSNKIDDTTWHAVSESHPYFFMKRFLDLAEKTPSDVMVIDESSPSSSTFHKRATLFEQIMLPSACINQWSTVPVSHDAISNLQYVKCQTRDHEVLQIALICKQAIEQGGFHDICIVTEHPTFKKMMIAALQSMHLDGDASEGKTIGDSVFASLSSILGNAAQALDNPLNILAVLKHPNCLMGRERIQVLSAARYIEKTLFRTNLLFPNIAAMVAHLNKQTTNQTHEHIENAIAVLLDYQRLLAPMSAVAIGCEQPFAKFLALHLGTIEAFSKDRSGQVQCWHFDVSGDAEQFMRELEHYAAGMRSMDMPNYLSILEMIFNSEPLRQTRQSHYHISLMPAEEARFQPAELTIIADMNEGVWPSLSGVNPWMSRPMQASIGLLMPESESSQKAHDLLMLMQSDKVIFTRSLMDERVETTESRWLQRLTACLNATNESLVNHLCQHDYNALFENTFQAADIQRETQPEPRPPLEARPTSYSITELETLQRDPYAIYAKKILKLKPLEPIGEVQEFKLFGDIAHQLLEKFVQNYPRELPNNISVLQVEQWCKDALSAYVWDSNLQFIWLPKLKSVMQWVINIEKERRAELKFVAAEVPIQAELVGELANYIIKGRVDRVEITSDNHFKVIDYKTGAVPTQKNINGHIEGQIAIATWLMQMQWPESLPMKADNAASGEYWKLSAQTHNAAVKPCNYKMEIDAFLADSKQHMIALLDYYQQEQHGYKAVPELSIKPRYHQYSQLERYAEWA